MPSLPRLARLAGSAALAFALTVGAALAQDAPKASTPQEAAKPAAAGETAGGWQTSISLIAPSKYPPDFKHYDYVNPDAPKGGTLNSAVIGSFDSFNPFIVRGTPAAGLATFGGGLLYDSLMEQSTDEPATSYGMIAEALRYPPDFSSVTFRLNPKARWHDGKPITVEDVIWSFNTLKSLHPQWAAYYKNVVKAEKTGDREVTFTFDQKNNRELPNIMGDLTVLPKHYWEGTGPDGKKRDISQPTSEPPLGSGPYRIGKFSMGKSIEWERVPDYWAADNPTRVGRYNYGRIDYTYFRDQNAAWEAFKKGGLDDYRIENISQRWAEGYDFPAVKNGEVIQKTVPNHSVANMQAYVLNNRLPKFQDRRVREALTLAFNFQEMNRTLFHGLYKRLDSYFANSELASSGLPGDRELKFLTPLKGKIPDEVFTKPFTLPDYDTANATRTYLRQAYQLLTEAGYVRKGTGLVNARTGEPFTIEMLGDDPSENRILEPYARSLERLGIKATVRIVDQNQYIDRLRNFDFEVASIPYYPQSLSPGNEQRDYWSSKAADSPGSRNYAGIKNPAIDTLINDIVFAKDRADLVAATHALDRVMLWEYYVIPQWYNDKVWLAYWTKLQMPKQRPSSASIDPYAWWVKGAGKDTASAK
ncbi:ABC transporter substrate-binding protein [Jiella sp. M17.18]|uniref:ABC transporter substrate-binding protein n=1 Tax=Jiella sp. M17.18 TaxID=3234247 RepID=UPI0034DFAB7C